MEKRFEKGRKTLTCPTWFLPCPKAVLVTLKTDVKPVQLACNYFDSLQVSLITLSNPQ